METLILWIFLGLFPYVLIVSAVSNLAEKKGRNTIGWWGFLFIAFPIAFILLLALGDTQEMHDAKVKHDAEIFANTYLEIINKNKEQ